MCGWSVLEPIVAHASLVFASPRSWVTRTGSPTPLDAPAIDQARRSRVLRYVLVNEARLKVDAYCPACRIRIGETYVREIGSRKTFCSFSCYRCSAEQPTPQEAAAQQRTAYAG
jgi:hypothetical protein